MKQATTSVPASAASSTSTRTSPAATCHSSKNGCKPRERNASATGRTASLSMVAWERNTSKRARPRPRSTCAGVSIATVTSVGDQDVVGFAGAFVDLAEHVAILGGVGALEEAGVEADDLGARAGVAADAIDLAGEARRHAAVGRLVGGQLVERRRDLGDQRRGE